jgi:hypothetical protein
MIGYLVGNLELMKIDSRQVQYETKDFRGRGLSLHTRLPAIVHRAILRARILYLFTDTETAALQVP